MWADSSNKPSLIKVGARCFVCGFYFTYINKIYISVPQLEKITYANKENQRQFQKLGKLSVLRLMFCPMPPGIEYEQNVKSGILFEAGMSFTSKRSSFIDHFKNKCCQTQGAGESFCFVKCNTFIFTRKTLLYCHDDF